MRTTFIQELILQARIHPEVFLMVGDLGFSVVEPFAEEFPDRFLNAGIAEQNMSGMAAGLASEGYHVFTYSIANFPVIRCLEQIRNDICYHGLPVTVVAVGGGLAYGSLGYSHHAVQDYALLRGFPGMMMSSPGDPPETRACLDYLCRHPQPSYLRLGKNGEAPQHEPGVPLALEPGSPVRVWGSPASRRIFLTTGTALEVAMEAVRLLPPGAEWAVYTLPLWAQHFTEQVCRGLSAFEKIVVVEEHLSAGGFGSYIRECAGNDPSFQARIATLALDPSVCGMVGSQTTLRRLGGLEPERLVSLARSIPSA